MTVASATQADSAIPLRPPLSTSDLRDEIAELEYQALLAERSHLDAALDEGRLYAFLGLLAAILGVLTTGSAFDFVKGWPWIKAHLGETKNLTGVLALLLTLTTACLNFRDPKGLRDRHTAAGRRFAALRMELRIFRRSLPNGRESGSEENATDKLLQFVGRYWAIAEEAAQITDKHHRMAKQRLSSNVHYKDLRGKTKRSETTETPAWYMCRNPKQRAP